MEHHFPYIFNVDIHEIIYKFRAFFTKQYFELKNDNHTLLKEFPNPRIEKMSCTLLII